MLRLRGGGKKRKKKVATKQKVKHVHKKVKLAFLKLYKVDDAGKVTRLHECPAQCGADCLHGQPLRPPLLRQVRPPRYQRYLTDGRSTLVMLSITQGEGLSARARVKLFSDLRLCQYSTVSNPPLILLWRDYYPCPNLS